jgi:CysZ protein
VQGVALAVRDLVWGLVYLTVVNGLIFVVSAGTFGLAAAPASIVSFCFSAWLLAHEFVGLALSRQLVGYRRRWRIVWANKWTTLGFGVACMGLLFVPGLNLVLLPLAAVGGTLLYCDLKAGGRVSVV